MELSIIIPAYNASATLSRAVNSVILQLQDQVELIIVENGSTDDTAYIALQFSQQYTNIIFEQSQKGVSNARNKGLSVAKGKYVTFLDADDVLSAHAITCFLNHIQSNQQLYIYKIQMGMRHVQSSGVMTTYEKDTLVKGIATIISNPTRYMQVCASVYCKQLIDDNNLHFDTTLFLSEDSDFTLQYLKYVTSFQVIDDVIYQCPGDNKQSVTRISDATKVNKMIDALEKTKNKVTWLLQKQQFLEAFNYYILMNFNVVMVREVFSRQTSQSFLKRHKSVVQYSQYPLIKMAMQQVTVKHIKNVRVWPFIFIKYKMSILASIMFTLRAIQNEQVEK